MFLALALGALGIGGIAAGCSSTKKEKGQEDGGAFPLTATPPYPLSIAGQNIEIFHRDLNGDGIVQPDREPLALKVGDIFIDAKTPAFEKYRAELRLPDFSGLEIRRWHRRHQELFSGGAGRAEEGRFLEIQAYGKDGRLAMDQVWDLAMALDPRSTEEKLDSLFIASFLLALQGGKENSFYLAPTSGATNSNKDIIDSSVAQIRKNRLKIRREPPNRAGVLMTYDDIRNRLEIPPGLRLGLDTFSKGLLLHELVHFHQDIHKARLSAVDAEVEAYLKEAEYSLSTHPWKAVSGPVESLVEEFHDEMAESRGYGVPRDLKAAPFQALRAAFHRKKGEIPEERAALGELETSVFYTYRFLALWEEGLESRTEALNTLIDRKVGPLAQAKGLQGTDPQFYPLILQVLGAEAARCAEELRGSEQEMRALNSRQDVTAEKLSETGHLLLGNWIMLRLVEATTEHYLAKLNGGSAPLSEPAHSDPKVRALLRLLPRTVFSPSFSRDGVE